MRRGIVIGFIVCYLLVLGFGIFSHALGYKSTDHVGMYYLIWDMYCGWSGYEYRQHLVAQGVSGQQYELTPAPGESSCRSARRSGTTTMVRRSSRERWPLTSSTYGTRGNRPCLADRGGVVEEIQPA